MIPKSEDRYTAADYEYNRRQFEKLERGKRRAFFLLGLSIFLHVACIYICRKMHIFSLSSVISKFYLVFVKVDTCSLHEFMDFIFLFSADPYYNMEGATRKR